MIGAASALTLPALGYGLVRVGGGEFPRATSPYAVDGSTRPLSSGEMAGPLLLLINERAENPFGAYLGEILRAEGLNCFQVAPLSAVDSAALERFHLVLLAEGPLDRAQVELMESYVARGGRLIAMRPDVHLAPLLGLERVAGNTAEGYLQVDTGHPAGRGLVAEALQFHGSADHYRLAGAQAVAWLADSAQARTDFPAVSLHRYGQGQAAMWAYDLGRSVAYMRQGNPAWANQERDGRDGVRAQDAFVGWVDLDRIAIPQADEQMRLLSRLISEMLSDVMPLPRLWYFPGTAGGMLIATGDSHQSPASAIEDVLARVEQRGGHMSIYYAPPLVNDWRRTIQRVQSWVADLSGASADLPTPSQVAAWRARGHEFTLHPYVEEGLEAGWQRYWQEFTGRGYGPVSPTVRTHRILWTGWVETARLQASYGIRMNLDYYHVGPAFQNKAGKWVFGHFTGSGLPMRFVDEHGRILNIYQQPTQLVDEHLLSGIRTLGMSGWVGLSGEAAIEVSQTLLRRSLDGAYGAIAAQFHIDPFAHDGLPASEAATWLEGTLDYAVEQGIPIWSAAEWLSFTEARHEATLDQIHWDPSRRRLSFRLVTQAAPDTELTLMIPLWHGRATLAQVKVDGLAVGYRERTVSGVSYGCTPIRAGFHQVVASYT